MTSFSFFFLALCDIDEGSLSLCGSACSLKRAVALFVIEIQFRMGEKDELTEKMRGQEITFTKLSVQKRFSCAEEGYVIYVKIIYHTAKLHHNY